MISINNLVPLHASIRAELLAAVERVIDSSEFILGKEVATFEAAAAKYLGVSYAVGVSSGTAALELALRAVDVQGSTVLTTSFSFVATAAAILAAGGLPAFVDIDPRTMQMDVPQALKLAEMHKPKVILPVHLYGQMLDVGPLCEWAVDNGAFVVEDAAQAFGARRNSAAAGTQGMLGCFSFFPTKNLGGLGDAGLIITNHPEFAAKIRALREPLFNGQTWPGATNARLDGLQAAALAVKLHHLNDWNASRMRIAARYNAAFGNLPEIACPNLNLGDIAHQYTLRTSRRDGLLKHLSANGVGARIYYDKSLPQYLGLYDIAQECPESLRAASEVISLPLHPFLSPNEQQHVIEVVRSF